MKRHEPRHPVPDDVPVLVCRSIGQLYEVAELHALPHRRYIPGGYHAHRSIGFMVAAPAAGPVPNLDATLLAPGAEALLAGMSVMLTAATEEDVEAMLEQAIQGLCLHLYVPGGRS